MSTVILSLHFSNRFSTSRDTENVKITQIHGICVWSYCT